MKSRDEAAIYQLAIHQNRARAALALSATLLGAGQPKFVPQNIQQSFHGIDAHGFHLAIYGKGNLAFAVIFEGVSHRSPWAETASKISSGKRGMESKRVPSASSIPLTMAGAGPSMGSSP